MNWLKSVTTVILMLAVFTQHAVASAERPGLHTSPTGNWALDAGCHWLYPDKGNDLQTYCGGLHRGLNNEWLLNAGCHWLYPDNPDDFQTYCGDKSSTVATTSANKDTSLAIVWLIVYFLIYFLPAIVARNRRHRQEMAIGILNLLLGWTVIGWVVALVWACTSDTRSETRRGTDYAQLLNDVTANEPR